MGEGGPLPRGRPTQGRADPGREAVFKDQRAAWHWAGMTWGARPRQSQGLGTAGGRRSPPALRKWGRRGWFREPCDPRSGASGREGESQTSWVPPALQAGGVWGLQLLSPGLPSMVWGRGRGGVSRDALIRGQFSHIIPNLKLSQLLVSVA